jgi:ABC-2 type transport system permease protein
MTERELSKVAATRRGIHDRLSAAGAGRAPDFEARRTLRLRVETLRQVKRRRTQVAFGLVLVLPIIIAIAFQVGGGAGADAPQLVELANTGAFNFALFTEFASVGFLLVVLVALFCGDTVASEASWSSLRYLLAQPVPRSRLLRQKLTIAGRSASPPTSCCRCGRSWSADCSSGGTRPARRSVARSARPHPRGD